MPAWIALKIVDTMVFFTSIWAIIYFHQIDYFLFELISLIVMAYTVMRRSDINTITLMFILLIANIIPGLLIDRIPELSSYMWHSTLFISNTIAVIVIYFRSFILLRYGPEFVRKNDELAMTRQDRVVGFFFILQACWQLLQFIEHMIRHLEDIGLSGLFGDWSPMFFYDTYKTGQFGFSILTLLILYFMTSDRSKEATNVRD